MGVETSLTIPFSIIAEIYLLLFNPFINVKLKRIFPEIFLNAFCTSSNVEIGLIYVVAITK